MSSLSDDSAMRRLGHAAPSAVATGVRVTLEGCEQVQEPLAEETPVSVVYNGVAHAVMMCTPADLEDFAVGFSITEGVIAERGELVGIQVVRYSRGIELQLEIPAALASGAGQRTRRLSGRTGCGICGMQHVDEVLREMPCVESGLVVTQGAIATAMRTLAAQQPLNALTGATHAAAWARADGSLAMVREDVGRHNALDKLVGAMLRAGLPPVDGFVVITSRGSFELVQKTALLGASLLVAVSAPTALAVRMAHRAGITLAGFARDDRVTIYTHPARVGGATV